MEHKALREGAKIIGTGTIVAVVAVAAVGIGVVIKRRKK